MSIRTVIVILLALICGGSAAVGVSQLRGQGGGTAPPETVPVVVAKLEIERGQTLTDDLIQIQQWPKGLTPGQSLSNKDDVLERAAVGLITVGEPILDRKLAPRDSGRGLAALVPRGMRAYTIQTSRIASNLAGFILPGNRVDVLLTLRGSGNDGTGGGSSTTLLQAVEVMAVDRHLDAPAENRVDPTQRSSVTLLVSPDQAALLDLGQNMGTLTLSLRNPEDLAEAETQPATLDILRYTQRRPIDEEKDSDSTVARPLNWLMTAAQAAFLHASAARASSIDDQPTPIYEIRTSRGRHSGHVFVRGSS